MIKSSLCHLRGCFFCLWHCLPGGLLWSDVKMLGKSQMMAHSCLCIKHGESGKAGVDLCLFPN